MRLVALMPNGRGGLYRGRITVGDGRIRDVELYRPGSSSGEDLDFLPHVALPGFIDLQINGAFGHDITSSPETLWPIGERLPHHGVTAFLPTVISSPAHQRQAAYEAIRARPAGYAGAEPLGLHVEGPALSPILAGVHPRGELIGDAADLASELIVASDVVALVTIAPEAANAMHAIERLAAAGIAVSLGHTEATAAQTAAALEAGATAFTHLFNGMAPLHHRELGAVGTALLDPRTYVSLIADRHHLADDAIRLVWRVIGPKRICLVTDAMAGMGAVAGIHRIGDVAVHCRGAARSADGGLAGSLITMIDAVRLVRELTGATWDELSAVTSANQAGLLGDITRGRIAPGARADLTIVDSDLRPVATFAGGAIVYRRPVSVTTADTASTPPSTPEPGRRAASKCRSTADVSSKCAIPTAIGVDIGGTTFKAAIVAGMRLGHLRSGATGPQRPAAEVLTEIRSVIEDLAGSTDLDVRGVGIVCAGILDTETGAVIRSESLNWRNVNVSAQLGRDLGLPVAVEHDVYAAALAEWETGAGVRAESMLYVSIGTGVASHLFTQAGTNRGHAGLAGEMGFIPADGGTHWLQSVASGRALTDAYRRHTGRSLNAEQIISSAGRDPVATRVWAAALDALAQGIASAVCLQDPEIIVIGGGVSNAGNELLDMLEPRLAAWLEPLRTPPTTVVAAHGADSGVMGAALLGGTLSATR